MAKREISDVLIIPKYSHQNSVPRFDGMKTALLRNALTFAIADLRMASVATAGVATAFVQLVDAQKNNARSVLVTRRYVPKKTSYGEVYSTSTQGNVNASTDQAVSQISGFTRNPFKVPATSSTTMLSTVPSVGTLEKASFRLPSD